MAHTVVGFFDEASEAQQAVSELVEFGIERNQIDVSGGQSGSTDSSVAYNSDDRGEKKSGIAKFFSSLFGDDNDDARKYSSVGENTNTIVTVHASTEEEAEEAADILDDSGAFNVDERASQNGFFSNDSLDSGRTRSDNDQTIQKAQEELQVGKRSVETGGVRVRSRIVERPVAENIRLREEHVRVDRQSVDRPVSSDDMGLFEEREIEMTERAEVPVVNKEARVVEEIRVVKEETERNETIRDTVRHTEVDIDDAGNKTDVGNTSNTNSGRTGNTRLDTDDTNDRLSPGI
jgi:uncharacterized protein (TIGR02271 family)